MKKEKDFNYKAYKYVNGAIGYGLKASPLVTSVGYVLTSAPEMVGAFYAAALFAYPMACLVKSIRKFDLDKYEDVFGSQKPSLGRVFLKEALGEKIGEFVANTKIIQRKPSVS